jgi:uncharacterized protein YidB (DUF937 family)
MMGYKDGLNGLKRYGLVFSGAYFLSLLGCAGTHAPSEAWGDFEMIYDHRSAPIKIEAISPAMGEGILERMFTAGVDTNDVFNRLWLGLPDLPVKVENDTTGMDGTVIGD